MLCSTPARSEAARGGPRIESGTRWPEAPVEPIRQTVTVRSDPERAFNLFTELMGTWWPVEAYSRAVSEFEGDEIQVLRLEFQAFMGGRILEHTSDGRILPW